MARSVVTLVGLLVALCVSGCGKGYLLYTEEIPSPAALSASPIQARELSFSFVPPAEWNVKDDVWATHMANFRRRWLEGLQEFSPRPVKPIEADAEVESGLVVEGDVTSITKNWNAFTAPPDHVFVTITFVDPATGEVAYKAKVETLGHGGTFSSFDGRVGYAHYLAGRAAGLALTNGHLER